MTFSAIDSAQAHAVAVAIGPDTLSVDLSDGRSIAIPLAWYPRLAHARKTELANWRFIANGEGIHWPDLDEDISISALLTGRSSTESGASLQRWLDSREG